MVDGEAFFTMPREAVLVEAEFEEIPGNTNIIYAGPDAQGDGDGRSWAHAYTDLQDAIDEANLSGNVIWAAAGAYVPSRLGGTPADPIDRAFVLKHNVKIYGGFEGTETEFGDRNWVSNKSTLSGNLGETNTCHVVIAVGTDVDDTVLLDGLYITEGQALGGGTVTVGGQSISRQYGGGMYNVNSSPVLRNTVFVENKAIEWGGGMYNKNAKPTLNGAAFTDNRATSYGGGMYNDAPSSPLLKDGTLFDSNTASNGGGMFNENSSPILIDVTFKDNMVNSMGGGMANDHGSQPVLIGVTFANNYADGAGGSESGGGLYATNNARPVVINSSFTGNTSKLGGGICVVNKIIIVNTLIAENTGKTRGGGIDIAGMEVAILINVTLADNKSPGPGDGGHAIYTAPSAELHLDNCIIWGNTGITVAVKNASSSTTKVWYRKTMIQDWSATNMETPGGIYCAQSGSELNINSQNPYFVSAADYSLTAASTAFVNTGGDSYYPAVAALGIAAALLSRNINLPSEASQTLKAYINDVLTKDQAGNDRINNGTIDLGAYEY